MGSEGLSRALRLLLVLQLSIEQAQTVAEQVEMKAKVVQSEVKAVTARHKKALEERECELLWKVTGASPPLPGPARRPRDLCEPQQDRECSDIVPWLQVSNSLQKDAAAKSLQSCPTLCDPRYGSPPDSSVPAILQARTLEWVAISFSQKDAGISRHCRCPPSRGTPLRSSQVPEIGWCLGFS